MAKSTARGIRRVIELALDAASARRMRQQAQDALDKGTDPRKAKKNVAEVEGAFGRLGGAAKKMGVALVAVFAVDRLRAFAVEMFQLGTQIEDTQSKFNTVFGKQGAAAVQAWIDANASVMGLSRVAAQESAAMMGAIVQGMGASQAASAGLSTRILTLAADLQSFHNVPIADGINSIKSALAGSWEPLDKFGIVLRQADVDARALADTNKKSARDLNNLDKAQAALNLMYERAGVAVGDLGKTKDATANKTRFLQAEYENMKGALATRLLPVFASLVDHLYANRKEMAQTGEAAWTLTKILAGGLFQAVHSLTSFMAGSAAVVVGALTLSYHSLADAVLAAALAKEKLKRAFGADNDVRGAQAALDRNDAEKVIAANMMRGGLREYARGYRLDAWRAVQNFKPAEGEFAWGAAPTIPKTPPAADAERKKARDKAAREAKAAEEARLRRHQEAQTQLDNAKAVRADTPDIRPAATSPALAAFEAFREAMGAYYDEYLAKTGELQSVAQSVAGNIVDVWQSAFQQILTDGASLSDALSGIMRGMAGAAVSGVSDLAKTKVAENIARAFEMFAMGFGFASLGNVPSAAAAKKSGVGHLAAAAKWGLLGAVSGGAGGALVNGGGGAGGRGGEHGRRREAPGAEQHIYNYDRAAARATEVAITTPRAVQPITINVDPFNPNSPVHQTAVGKGVDLYVERHGRRELW